ncbi:MAG TPA: alpha/beta hydrolase [Verrucomicrobiaceae bacterium]|jgi:acetyl esterase/lipase
MNSKFFTAFLIVAFTGSLPAAKRESLPVTPPDTLRVEMNVEYGKTPEQVLKMDVYRPKEGGDKLPACVLVHGGGWTGGDKEKFTPLAIALAQRGYVVANIEYRLAGAAKYPAAVQDCNAAVRFVRANAKRFGLDPNRIGAWGGSAGGHLVGLMAAAPSVENFAAGNKDVSARIQAAVVMAGPMELNSEKMIESLRKAKAESNSYKWLGRFYDDAPELYREASPMAHLDKQTAPTLFLRGALDNPEADTAAMEKLKSLGVPAERIILPDAKHGCWLQRPWFEQCVEAVDAFFKKQLK